jgi:hypothetical protein
MPLGRFVRKRIFQPTTGLCPRLGFLELEEIRIKLRSLFKRLEKRVAQRYERLQGRSLCHLAFISFHGTWNSGRLPPKYACLNMNSAYRWQGHCNDPG